jgi:predicted nucleotidyltransferase
MKDILETKTKIIEILHKHQVKRASLFGSVVRGEDTEDSDIDLLVEFDGRKSLLDLVGLKLDLEDTLQREFDVLTYDSLHPLLKDRILKEQVAIL